VAAISHLDAPIDPTVMASRQSVALLMVTVSSVVLGRISTAGTGSSVGGTSGSLLDMFSFAAVEPL